MITMISTDEISDIVSNIKVQMGISSFYEIINETQATKMRVGRELMKKGNVGARHEKSTIYILQEKMTSIDKCVFAVATQLTRKWIIPKHNTTDVLLEKIIDKEYTILSYYNDTFRKNLYGLLGTAWLLFDSGISDDYKLSYCNFGKKLFDPTNLEGIDNGMGRKILNNWELNFRLQNFMIEDYLGEPPSNSSTACLDSGDKTVIFKLVNVLKKMSKSFWSDYKILLTEFNDVYARFRSEGTDNDKREVNIEDKKITPSPSNITYLDGDVFYQRCKNKGLSDSVIRAYFEKAQKLENVQITGIGAGTGSESDIVSMKTKRI